MSRESGSALLLALVALTVIALCVMVAASQVQVLQMKGRYDERNAILGALSDAAFAETLALLSADQTSVGFAERGFGGGTISSGVLPVGEFGRRVTAVATYRGWSATIVAEVDVTAGPVVVRLTRSQGPSG